MALAVTMFAQAGQYRDLLYEASDTEIRITGYAGPGGAISIPDTIDGLPVTRIASMAFQSCSSLTSVAIPESVTSIGSWAFDNCASMTAVNLPENIREIATATFRNCRRLGSIAIPDGVTYIHEDAFRDCISLASITIPDSVTELGVAAFHGCSSLAIVDLGGNKMRIGNGAFGGCFRLSQVTMRERAVTTIGSGAFGGCARLAAITIPDGVTRIETKAFMNCENLSQMFIPQDLTSLEDQVFMGCSDLSRIEVDPLNPSYSSLDGVLFNREQTTLLHYPRGRRGGFELPNGVTAIGERAFSQCAFLTEITIPEGVTSIGKNAFEDCPNLISITIPDGVTSIRIAAFSGCSSLANLTIPEGVMNIEPYTFWSCERLTEIVIPHSVKSIGREAFGGCANLETITIPAEVTSIEDEAFLGCTGLIAIHVDPANRVYSSIDGVLLNLEQTTLIRCPPAKAGHYLIPNGVERIEADAFSSCVLLPEIFIPETVIQLPWGSFSECSSLISVEVDPLNPAYSSLDGLLFNKDQTTLLRHPADITGDYVVPAGVRGIAEAAFAGCTGLTSISFHGDVFFGDRVFYGCTGLTQLTFPDRMRTLEDEELDGCFNLVTVTIPSGVDVIHQSLFHDCWHLTNIEVSPENDDFISFDGVLFDKRRPTLLVCPKGKTGHYSVPDRVTRIGEDAFSDSRLTSITFPQTVGWLEEEALSWCWNLAAIRFEGDCPDYDSEDENPIKYCPSAIVYYRSGTQGWGSSFFGCPTVVWVDPPVFANWVVSTRLPSEYPDASGESDDPDGDGMTNHAEMLAGTDPVDRASLLTLEAHPRPDDLSDEDRRPLGFGEHALYIQSVPGKQYGIQWTDSLSERWHTDEIVTAETSQKRVALEKLRVRRFYRVVLAQ